MTLTTLRGRGFATGTVRLRGRLCVVFRQGAYCSTSLGVFGPRFRVGGCCCRGIAFGSVALCMQQVFVSSVAWRARAVSCRLAQRSSFALFLGVSVAVAGNALWSASYSVLVLMPCTSRDSTFYGSLLAITAFDDQDRRKGLPPLGT